MHWYYSIDGSKSGPVPEEELRRLAAEGTLKPADMVWRADLGPGWVPAGDALPQLFARERAAPPPLPAAGAAGAGPPRPGTGRISCRAAAADAWQRMREILFAPFDIGKWFVLGFSAWLASLGRNGGVNPFGGLDLSQWRDAETAAPDFGEVLGRVQEFVRLHFALVAVAAVAGALLVLAVELLLMWVRARAAFVFLHNVVRNRADIAEPWRSLRRQGNSLFGWALVFTLICGTIVLLLLGATVWAVAVPCWAGGASLGSVIPGLVGVGVLWLVFLVAASYVARFLEDFVVPIMYAFGLTATQAWGHFLRMFACAPWRFLGYGIFYALLTVLAGGCVLAVVLMTCCVAGCLMVIPYIGAVVLLPVSIFFRAFSLAYLAQHGPEYRV